MSHGSKYGICVVKIYDIVYFAMIPEFLGPNLVASAKRLRLGHRWVFLKKKKKFLREIIMNPDMHPNKQKQIRDIKSVFDRFKMPKAKKYKEAVLRSGQRSSTRPRSEEF